MPDNGAACLAMSYTRECAIGASIKSDTSHRLWPMLILLLLVVLLLSSFSLYCRYNL